MKHYQNITDEQIANELASLKNYLLICGDTGSGKTKLINRILKHIETLDDTLYIFITNDFFNHTGENSYGHINAERLHIDNIIKGEYLNVIPINTAIEFPYTNLPDKKCAGLLNYIDRFMYYSSKRIIIITDDINIEVNKAVYRVLWGVCDLKFITTEISKEYFMNEMNETGFEESISNYIHL